MCIICLDFQKSKLTIDEAWRIIPEMKETINPHHMMYVKKMLAKAMDEEREQEQEQDDT